MIRIDQRSEEPLYLQIRTQIIAAIANGEIAPGTTLPSVRTLAQDLGINLHTVNKAYAVLRDEGYVVMRGRAGAIIADPAEHGSTLKTKAAAQQLDDSLYSLALALKARGGKAEDFMAHTQAAMAKVFTENEPKGGNV